MHRRVLSFVCLPFALNKSRFYWVVKTRSLKRVLIAIFDILCYSLLLRNQTIGVSKMNVSLTPELEQFVNAKVNSGMYTSASEVIRESLRLLHTYEDLQSQRVKQLNQAIDIGLQQLEGGDKVLAKDSYAKFTKKINKIEKAKEKAKGSR